MPKKLLIADDSITIQKVMTITFPAKEYELVIVGNGDDAIKKSVEVKPDLVIADIGMPGKNGYEVCEIIKKTPELKNVPVLLLSGAFEPFDANKAKSVGADDYIVKPFETQALINKVNQLLAKAPPKEEKKEMAEEEAEIEESLSAELGQVVEAETPEVEATAEGMVEEGIAEAEPVEEPQEEVVETGEAVETIETAEPAGVSTQQEAAPEDLWSMEGFEGVEEKSAPEAPPAEEAVSEEGIVPLAEEVGAEPAGEEAIPLDQELEEGIPLGEEERREEAEVEAISEAEPEPIPVEEATLEGVEVEEAEPVAKAEPVVESVPEQAVQKGVIPQEEISREIHKQVTEVLSRLLPRLVEKITEEVIASIAKGFVKEAIEKSNIHEVTRRMIEEELKKNS